MRPAKSVSFTQRAKERHHGNELANRGCDRASFVVFWHVSPYTSTPGVTVAAGPLEDKSTRHRQKSPAVQSDGKSRHLETLRCHQRLRDPGDFQRVYAAQKVIHAPNVVLFFCPNGMLQSRLGVSVGRKHGNAVRRNRIKRVLRAAYRQSQHLLPGGYDYVLVPRREIEYTTADIATTLEKLAQRIHSPGQDGNDARKQKK
jgi:ribonuclease P protein component